MALDAKNHGVSVFKTSANGRKFETVPTATWGVVCTAEDADQAYFPLNKPVYVVNIDDAIAKAGLKGTLKRTLTALGSQGNFGGIVVRVAEGSTEAETTANVIGTVLPDGTRTGLEALKLAKSLKLPAPKIFAVPIYDTLPVANALANLALKMNGFAYVSDHSPTIQESVAYRVQFGSGNVMLLSNSFTDLDVDTGEYYSGYETAYALSRRAWLDKNIGWHVSIGWGNFAGPEGLVYQRTHSVTDSECDTQFLFLNGGITSCVIDGGAKFFGNNSCSEEASEMFECYTRVGQILAETMQEGLKQFLDLPMNVRNIREMLNKIDQKLKELTRFELIAGGEAKFDILDNPPEAMVAGDIMQSWDYAPFPPMQNIKGKQVFDGEKYMALLAASVATTL